VTKTNVKAWMPIYVGDWEADTQDLTCEEDGAYWRLVRHYWRRGAPPNDDATLATIVRVPLKRWIQMRPKLEPFFKIKRARWSHSRIERELKAAVDKKTVYSERNRAAAKSRWAKEKNATCIPKTCPSPSPSPERKDSPSGNILPFRGATPDSLAGGDRACASQEGLRLVVNGVPEEPKQVMDRAELAAAMADLAAEMRARTAARMRGPDDE